MGNKLIFFLSAFIAVSLYCFFIVFFIFYTKQHHVKKIDAVSKYTILQLDIVMETKEDDLKKINIESVTKKSDDTVVKKSTSVSAKRRTNLKSLFANVKTTSANIVKEKVLNVQESSIASRFKSKFEKEKKVQNISLSDLNNNKKTNIKNVQTSESKYESDPYYSKIYQIISNRWTPTVFFNDLEAKVLILISSNGEFSYKFIQYSNNIGFDNQLKEFLYNEVGKIYPINPNNKSTKIEITFKSKGE